MSGLGELREYYKETGQEFNEDWCGGQDSMVEKEFKDFLDAGKTPEQFYRESKTYPYLLSSFGDDIWKKPYHNQINSSVQPGTMLEYGCGVGSDGLLFIEKGWDVSFYDHDSTTCTKFLAWRLKQRGLKNKIFTHKSTVPFVDLVFAFDTIEHVPTDTQETLLRSIEKMGKVTAVNFLKHIEPRSGTQLHHHVNYPKLLERIHKECEVISEIDYDYSILIIYRSAIAANLVAKPNAILEEAISGEQSNSR